jgi:hypothetical protein
MKALPTFRAWQTAMAVTIALAGTIIYPAAGFAQAKQSKVYGQVVSVKENLKTQVFKSFALVHGRQTTTIKVTTATQFVPRSTAADVQGFVPKDYAFVVTRVTTHPKAVRAVSVLFDTVPFHPAPTQNYSGQIARVGKQGLFITRLSDGATTKRAWRTAQTSYYLNGNPVEVPLSLRAGASVMVFTEKSGVRWMAISINELTSSGNHRSISGS